MDYELYRATTDIAQKLYAKGETSSKNVARVLEEEQNRIYE
jgi:hypothetical protein